MRSRMILVLVVLALTLGVLLRGALGWAAAQDGEATPDSGPPAELVIDGQRYSFDREVQVDLTLLQEIAQDPGTPVFVKVDPDPLNAVYAPDDGAVRRYLPQFIDSPETACPTETSPAASIEGNGAIYIPAGIDPDVSPEQLVQVGQTADGRTLYAPSTEQPFQELYATGADGGLLHFVLVQDDGVPVTFPEQISFAGQRFQLVGAGVTGPDGLQKVGCAGAFPALAASDEAEGSFRAIHLQAADQLVTYEAIDTPEPTGQPTQPPIDTATPPTGEPTQAPTQAATATLVPTVIPTEAPTVQPTEAPTVAPTETQPPTEQPTDVPPTAAPTDAPSPTEAPTAAPTSAPTAAPTDAPEPPATVAPTQAPATTAPTATPPSRPTPTPQVLQPPAVVPTLPADAPPPAAATSPANACSGIPGPIGDDGLPERLPPAVQYGGTGYRFVESVPIDDLGDLRRIGCVGPFEAFTGDDGVIYLTLSGVADRAFRFEATSSFEVSVEVTSDPRVIILQGQGDQPDVRYRASDPLVRSVYSSVTLVLYVADAADEQPDRVLGHAVDHDLLGEYVPEGSADQAPEEVLAQAEAFGILPTLRLGTAERTYVLVALWEPIGTTTNGWLTLYGPSGEPAPDQLVGIDPRRLDLAVFNRVDQQ